ncbi:glycosyltransferase [Umboniibacter marinipuniceus]|uniref:Glycosyltransferase involved in cell wall biosynthesis n=1 Tax=Umboniibacter marinipuniceus TaxID=569599 RepID=A0A3M0A6D2_9GAMM|nr:glycosyltransferase [Umboniibacter marinipuniceus]RMA80156.1 glycosyltransferase involved in cell wall biosynthesis [Umboniibacter marinipuniceus]
MNKHVLLAIFTLRGGGAERNVISLAKLLVDAGHHVDIVVFKNQIEHDIPPGITVHYFPYAKYRSIPRFLRGTWVAKRFDRWVKRFIGQPDLILSNLFPVDLVLSRSKLANVVLVLHAALSDEVKTTLKAWDPNEVLKVYRSKPVAGNCEDVVEDFVRFTGSRFATSVLPTPIITEDIDLKSRAFNPGVEGYLVSVGRFEASKHLDHLINAYVKSGISEKLVIVGSGKEEPVIREQIKALGRSKDIILTGFIANPYPFIRHAVGFVLCAENEAQGLVIRESAILNTGFVAQDSGLATKALLADHQRVPFGDEEALASKLRVLVASPEQFSVPKLNFVSAEQIVDAHLDLIK